MKPDLGKLLFPRLPPDLQRRKLRVMFAVLLTGLVLAGVVALVMFEADKPRLF